MSSVTTVSIPLHGVSLADPRIGGLLDLVDRWAENNDIQSPVYTVVTTSDAKETP